MKSVLKCAVLLAALACGTAAAATFEDGMRYKKDQKLEQAAAAFSEVVAREPRNAQALEQLAVVESWLNRYDASINNWHKAIALAPNKADYHIGLARVLYWKGGNDEALRELDTALGYAPKNVDALVLKGDVLMGAGRPSEARKAYEQAKAISGDAGLDKKIAAAVPPRRWRLDAGYTTDDYSALRSAENSSFLQLGHTSEGGTTLYARAERLLNFDQVDSGFTVGTYFLPADWLLLNAEVGTSPGEVDFRADSQALLNAEFLLKGPLQPLLGFRYLKYDQGNVTTVTPGLRLLIGSAALEARYGYSTNTDDSHTAVTQARLSFPVGSAQPYLAYFTGEEALPPLAKADIDVLVAGCTFDLSPSWGARIDYTHEDREDTYTHDAVGAGLTYKF